MKTSILISSFAALCLLITFAEAPRRYAEDKMDLTSTDNSISIVTTNKPVMLPGVVIIPGITAANAITNSVIAAEDLSYLRFNVDEYMEADAAIPVEVDIFSELSETDFSYLKFNVNHYISGSELNGDELAELPESETITDLFASESTLPDFDYLRFDVNDYIFNSLNDASGIGELPLIEESKTDIESKIAVTHEIINNFEYLKFDVTKYYNPNKQSTEEKFELPAE